jgi:hypothetical protein
VRTRMSRSGMALFPVDNLQGEQCHARTPCSSQRRRGLLAGTRRTMYTRCRSTRNQRTRWKAQLTANGDRANSLSPCVRSLAFVVLRVHSGHEWAWQTLNRSTSRDSNSAFSITREPSFSTEQFLDDSIGLLYPHLRPAWPVIWESLVATAAYCHDVSADTLPPSRNTDSDA